MNLTALPADEPFVQDAIEVELDSFGKAIAVNETDIPLDGQDLEQAMRGSAPLMAALSRWTRSVQSPGRGRRGVLLDRDRYLSPNNVFDQIRVAREAAEADDVVGGVQDLTESLAFKRSSFWCEDEDEQNIWNQWASTVNLDWLLRAAWRQHFTDSQVVIGLWWEKVNYRVEGSTDTGRKRRATFNVWAPVKADIIDTLKVTPVGNLLFGRERLAYIATATEAAAFDDILAAERVLRTNRLPSGAPLPPRWRHTWEQPSLDDPVVHRLIQARYRPDEQEATELRADGVDPTYLYLMDDTAVFRHTATKPGFKRFAPVRMRSAFELLDLKNQQRHMDRVTLMGGINFLVLIKQGSDKEPADAAEIAHLRANVQTIAQVPIIVGPHTLSVEIVTPKLDTVLSHERWDVVDERLLARLLRQFRPVKGGSGSEKGKDLAQTTGHWLENERLMLRRSFEKHVFARMLARNDDFRTRPKLRFHPARVALAFDPEWASFLMDLRASNELSRDTLLSQFEIDQAAEAAMRLREERDFDDIFQTHVPFDSRPGGGDGGAGGGGTPEEPQDPAARRAMQRRAGRRGGGNRNGGGAAPGTGQGQEPRNPRRLSSSLGLGRDALLAEAKDLGVKGRHRMNNRELEAAIIDALDALEGEEDS